MHHMFLDTENTGLEAGSRAVEIAAIMADGDGNVVSRFETLVKPGMPIPPDVSKIHGITDAEVVDKPSTETALGAFLDWLRPFRCGGGVAGVAHNASYDINILNWEFGRSGMPIPAFHMVDTCAMAKAIKATKNNKLSTLAEHYSITSDGPAHRAAADADVCRQYYNIARTLTLPLYMPWASENTYVDELPEVLALLPELVATGGLLKFGYTDAQGAKTDRAITPYGWAMAKTGIQFHGLCHLRNERRTFNADRVQG